MVYSYCKKKHFRNDDGLNFVYNSYHRKRMTNTLTNICNTPVYAGYPTILGFFALFDGCVETEGFVNLI